MSEHLLTIEHLEQVLEALNRIPSRMEGIVVPAEFLDSPDGQDRLDAICMILIATGEALKRIDERTGGGLLALYPEIDWQGVKGVRDVLAHGYFDVDVEQVFAICRDDIPLLISTVKRMLEDLRSGGE